MDSKETGRFICALRKSKGLTQLALAELLGVSNRTVSKWETGEGMPDISLLPELAAALGVTADELLAGKRLRQSAPVKIEEIKNRDNLLNLFKISFVVALFFAIFGALLGSFHGGVYGLCLKLALMFQRDPRNILARQFQRRALGSFRAR